MLSLGFQKVLDSNIFKMDLSLNLIQLIYFDGNLVCSCIRGQWIGIQLSPPRKTI